MTWILRNVQRILSWGRKALRRLVDEIGRALATAVRDERGAAAVKVVSLRTALTEGLKWIWSLCLGM